MTTKRAVTVENNVVNSQHLIGSARELVIRHIDEEYRLRITGNGKLILTK